MSNPLAIAAVTATLRNLLLQGITLEPALADTLVTTQAPDLARGTNNVNQVNLFLYHLVGNGAWRNMNVPQQVRPGETGQPPLALNLHYLITAYGRNNDDIFTHHLLGRAMRVIHDHPLLGAAEIRAALPESDLHTQFERIRFTWNPLSMEEISKLWTTYQTHYRLSVAYEATVVLIDSTRSSRAPLPVLRRGPEDRGPEAGADLIPPFPAIEAVIPPNSQDSAELGDLLTVEGHHLDGILTQVRFTSPRRDTPIDVPPEPGGTATRLTVRLPTDVAAWPAGFYRLAVRVRRASDQARITNELPFALAPRITPPATVARDPNGDATIVVACVPNVLPDQRAVLLLGDREAPAEPHPAPSSSLTFIVRDAAAGEWLVRVRLDGVDSRLVDRTVVPPQFDPTQKVTIT